MGSGEGDTAGLVFRGIMLKGVFDQRGVIFGTGGQPGVVLKKFHRFRPGGDHGFTQSQVLIDLQGVFATGDGIDQLRIDVIGLEEIPAIIDIEGWV
jgi:hypothetical protein